MVRLMREPNSTLPNTSLPRSSVPQRCTFTLSVGSSTPNRCSVAVGLMPHACRSDTGSRLTGNGT